MVKICCIIYMNKLNPGGWVNSFYVIILVEKAVSVAAAEMMMLGKDLQLKEQWVCGVVGGFISHGSCGGNCGGRF